MKVTKIVLIILFFLSLLILGLYNLLPYIGLNGYKNGIYRVGSSSIEESKKRGVFVRELHFEIDSFYGTLNNFKPFIEKGFRYGLESEKETKLLQNSKYPFQLSFNWKPIQGIQINILSNQLHKFDSSDANWGYLKQPILSDTIILVINQNSHLGTIKVWE